MGCGGLRRGRCRPGRRDRRGPEAGDWFDIRYGSLIPQGVGNLLMAGRCICADIVAHASLRIQQTCMAMGEAAGTAAALSLEQGVSPDQLDVRLLVDELFRARASVKPFISDFAGLPAPSANPPF